MKKKSLTKLYSICYELDLCWIHNPDIRLT